MDGHDAEGEGDLPVPGVAYGAAQRTDPRGRSPGWTPSGRIGTMWSVDQLGLSPFVAGDLVQWWDARGRRTGRFIGVIVRGPHRGTAEVAVGGALVEERIIRVPMADLAAAGSGRGRARV